MNRRQAIRRAVLPVLFLLAVLPAATLTPAASNVLTVDATQPIHPFTSQHLGQAFVNWEHSWGKPFLNAVPGLVQAMRAAQVGLIRYAGGNWANSVGFDPARTQITPYTSWTYDGFTYWFDYGTDEITSVQNFAQAIGADVMVQMNVSNNDPPMWANMVRYTNAPGKYPIRYWELGNELDIANPPMDPTVYGNRAIGYQQAMYAVDPSIKLIGGVPAFAVPANGSNSALNGLLTTAPQVVHNGGRNFDSISYHWYMQCNTTSLADVLRYRWYDSAGNPINPTVWNNAYSRYWADYIPGAVRAQVLAQYPGTTQGVTELNVDACNYDNVYNGNHINALWLSDILGRLAYSGLDYATLFTGYGSQGYAVLYPDDVNVPTRLFPRPSYYAYLMYAKYFGDQLVASSSYKNDDISIWAAMDSRDPGRLKLRITNMTAGAITVPVSLSGFSAGTGRVYTLQSTNPTDTSATSNTASAATNINGVKIDAMNVDASVATIPPQIIVVNGSSFSYTFPAYSSVAIVLDGAGAPTATPSTPGATLTATSTVAAVPSATRTPSPSPASSPSATITPSTATGFSLALNGTSAYADAPHHAELNLTGDWTVETWFKDEALGGYSHPSAYLVIKGDITQDAEIPYLLRVNNGQLQAGLRTVGTNYVVSANLTGVTANAWHHAAATFQSSSRSLTLYLDGVQVSQTTIAASTTVGNTKPVQLGRSATGGRYWLGKLDDVRLWNVVRTAAQIQGSYQTELMTVPAGLVANWQFDEGTGMTAADRAGVAQPASLQGGATWSSDIGVGAPPPSGTPTTTAGTTASATPSPTGTPSATSTTTPSPTPSNSPTPLPISTATPSATSTRTALPTSTATASPTPVPTATSTATLTPTASSTAVPATATVTAGTVCTGITATASPVSPQTVGTAVSLTASASGCSNPEYRYIIISPTGGGTIARDWASSSTFTWNTTGLTLGAYQIRARARQSGSTVEYQATTTLPYTLR